MNPYLILGFVVILATSNWYSYSVGGEHKENEMRANYATDLEVGIAKFNEEAEADKAQAVKVAARNAAAQARAAALRGKTSVVIREKPMPVVCDWEPKSFGLLVAAVQAANGTTETTASGLRDAVRKSNGTGK